VQELKTVKMSLSKNDWQAYILFAKQERKQIEEIKHYKNPFPTSSIILKPLPPGTSNASSGNVYGSSLRKRAWESPRGTNSDSGTPINSGRSIFSNRTVESQPNIHVSDHTVSVDQHRLHGGDDGDQDNGSEGGEGLLHQTDEDHSDTNEAADSSTQTDDAEDTEEQYSAEEGSEIRTDNGIRDVVIDDLENGDVYDEPVDDVGSTRWNDVITTNESKLSGIGTVLDVIRTRKQRSSQQQPSSSPTNLASTGLKQPSPPISPPASPKALRNIRSNHYSNPFIVDGPGIRNNSGSDPLAQQTQLKGLVYDKYREELDQQQREQDDLDSARLVVQNSFPQSAQRRSASHNNSPQKQPSPPKELPTAPPSPYQRHVNPFDFTAVSDPGNYADRIATGTQQAVAVVSATLPASIVQVADRRQQPTPLGETTTDTDKPSRVPNLVARVPAISTVYAAGSPKPVRRPSTARNTATVTQNFGLVLPLRPLMPAETSTIRTMESAPVPPPNTTAATVNVSQFSALSQLLSQNPAELLRALTSADQEEDTYPTAVVGATVELTTEVVTGRVTESYSALHLGRFSPSDKSSPTTIPGSLTAISSFGGTSSSLHRTFDDGLYRDEPENLDVSRMHAVGALEHELDFIQHQRLQRWQVYASNNEFNSLNEDSIPDAEIDADEEIEYNDEDGHHRNNSQSKENDDDIYNFDSHVHPVQHNSYRPYRYVEDRLIEEFDLPTAVVDHNMQKGMQEEGENALKLEDLNAADKPSRLNCLPERDTQYNHLQTLERRSVEPSVGSPSTAVSVPPLSQVCGSEEPIILPSQEYRVPEIPYTRHQIGIPDTVETIGVSLSRDALAGPYKPYGNTNTATVAAATATSRIQWWKNAPEIEFVNSMHQHRQQQHQHQQEHEQCEQHDQELKQRRFDFEPAESGEEYNDTYKGNTDVPSQDRRREYGEQDVLPFPVVQRFQPRSIRIMSGDDVSRSYDSFERPLNVLAGRSQQNRFDQISNYSRPVRSGLTSISMPDKLTMYSSAPEKQLPRDSTQVQASYQADPAAQSARTTSTPREDQTSAFTTDDLLSSMQSIQSSLRVVTSRTQHPHQQQQQRRFDYDIVAGRAAKSASMLLQHRQGSVHQRVQPLRQGRYHSLSRICVASGPLQRAQDEYPIRIDSNKACIDVVWKETLVRQPTQTRHNTPRRGPQQGTTRISTTKLRRERVRFDDMLVGFDKEQRLRGLVQAQVRSSFLRGCSGICSADVDASSNAFGGRLCAHRLSSCRSALTYVLTGSLFEDDASRQTQSQSQRGRPSLEYIVERMLGSGAAEIQEGPEYSSKSQISVTQGHQQCHVGLVSHALDMLFNMFNHAQSTASTSSSSFQARTQFEASSIPQVTLSILHTWDEQVTDLLASSDKSDTNSDVENDSQPKVNSVGLRRRKSDGSVCVTGATKVALSSVNDYYRIISALLARRSMLREVHSMLDAQIQRSLTQSAFAFPSTSMQAKQSHHSLRRYQQQVTQTQFQLGQLRNQMAQSGIGASGGAPLDAQVRWAGYEANSSNRENAPVQAQTSDKGDCLVIIINVTGRCLMPRTFTDGSYAVARTAPTHLNTDPSWSGEYRDLYDDQDAHNSDADVDLDADLDWSTNRLISTPVNFTLQFVCPTGTNWNQPGKQYSTADV
jgi:hypothetical protein